MNLLTIQEHKIEFCFKKRFLNSNSSGKLYDLTILCVNSCSFQRRVILTCFSTLHGNIKISKENH